MGALGGGRTSDPTCAQDLERPSIEQSIKGMILVGHLLMDVGRNCAHLDDETELHPLDEACREGKDPKYERGGRKKRDQPRRGNRGRSRIAETSRAGSAKEAGTLTSSAEETPVDTFQT